ncbi:MAG: disulfide bond formation protein B [Alphaproteobacteria bacterium]|nr:MAG: disulfide bond formation protein B [Alphaproteobacteria bacterium]
MTGFRISSVAGLGAVTALGSASVLGAALASQYLGGLRPCELCLWQRWPWAAAILLGAAAMLLPTAWGRVVLAAAAAALVVGTGIAGFHVGVEAAWWAGTSACGATSTPLDLEGLRRQLLSQPVVRCDEPAFVLAGLSMAGWNAVVSLAAALGLAFGLVRAGASR